MSEYRFDPYQVSPFRVAEKIAWWAPLPAMALTFVAWALGAWHAGVLGRFQDQDYSALLAALLGVETEGSTASDFSLAGDPLSWGVGAIAAASGCLILLQWRYMEKCIPEAVESGALTPKRDDEGNDMLAQLVGSANGILGRRWTGAAIILSLAMFVGLELSGTRNGMYANFAPANLQGDDVAAWSRQAYESWWASENHLIPYALYHIFLIFAAYCIVLQNLVGLVTVGVVARLRKVSELSADWSNVDGRYGWSSFQKVFATVEISLFIHGLGLSILILMIGTDHVRWLSLLIAMWVIFVCLYLLLPWYVFRGTGRAAAKREISRLQAEAKGADKINAHQTAMFIANLKSTKISPIGLAPRGFFPRFAGILFPVLIAFVQVIVTS